MGGKSVGVGDRIQTDNTGGMNELLQTMRQTGARERGVDKLEET